MNLIKEALASRKAASSSVEGFRADARGERGTRRRENAEA